MATFLAIAAIGVLASEKLRKNKQVSPSGETIALILGVYGAIYGVLLAFVIVIAWEDLSTAKSRVDMESAALASVVRDSQFFTPPVRNAISGDMDRYVDHTVEVEWKQMSSGVVPSASNPALESIFSTLKGYTPRNASEVAAYEQILTNLNDAIADRRARIGDSEDRLPPLLQYFIFGGAVCVIMLASLYKPKSVFDRVMVLVSITALLAASLLVVIGLNRPFTGDISVSPDAFYRGILAQYR
ncbi:hypothetical protein ACGFX8_37270 [Streptomyces sp. NPDC048362]|uniref:bestrophin-like domain n=1 Tax=Streptomyces sp. NPDC048362 TaxID=3365539 RepID=UPI00370F8CDA